MEGERALLVAELGRGWLQHPARKKPPEVGAPPALPVPAVPALPAAPWGLRGCRGTCLLVLPPGHCQLGQAGVVCSLQD